MPQPKPQPRQIKIPMSEIYQTMTALILERVFGYARQQQDADWKWRGLDIVTNRNTGWLVGWDALPPLLTDLELLYTALSKMVVGAKTRTNELFSTVQYDPAGPEPHGCMLMGIPTGGTENQPLAAGRADKLTVAIAMAMLNYYGADPVKNHKLYFPATYLELPDEAANQGIAGASEAGRIILPGGAPKKR